MASIQRFEDIRAWQRARELTRRIYLVSGTGGFARDFGLRDQIRRASVSIVSNIAEGFGRGGTAEFRQFLSQARGSTAEVQAQLYVALDIGLIPDAEFHEIYDLADDVSRMIGAFMVYLRDSERRGAKFRTAPYSALHEDRSSGG
jgi:four helix bundle protein